MVSPKTDPDGTSVGAGSSSAVQEGRVYLTGFMGAGKSVVGKALAGVLDCAFVDLDTAVESRAGRRVAAIFATTGEPAFRQLEHECLVETGDYPAVVVATGGGTVLSERNRAMIGRLGTSVWLNLSFETIAARLGADARKDRPLFRSPQQAQTLFEQRYTHYRRADLRIDIEAVDSPATVAATIASLLGRSPCAT